jgi:hypothetical protein
MTYAEMTPEQQDKIDAEETEREERKARREPADAQALERAMSRTPIYSAEWWRLSVLYERALGLH